MKDIIEIDEKINSKTAIVYTAKEFKEIIQSRDISPNDVDLVTCGTFGVMSGTMAVFTIPVTNPGVFKKADIITLNGVPGNVGPCPNESLGMVDCIVYGTAHKNGTYGGGHLFRDLVKGEKIEVIVTSEGKEYKNLITLDEIPHARMVLTRAAFKNYTGFVNPSKETESTIFSGPNGLEGNLQAASVCGCGEINPIQNDQELRFIKTGLSVMINGAKGIIIGPGTRSTPEKPNISASADMKDMDYRLMGGFITSRGAECLTSVAVVLPVVDEESIKSLSIRDDEVKLPMANVCDRIPVNYDAYSSVWKDDNKTITFDESKCIQCCSCKADKLCPVSANPSKGLENNELCVSCGLCVSTCVGKAFSCDLGSLDYQGTDVPIIIRQSSRAKAEDICELLKEKVENGEWNLRGD